MTRSAVLAALEVRDGLEVDSPADARILDAALVLVGEYGERRLTMDDVALKAKVGRRTVFRRFGSKDALLARLYRREVVRAVEYVAPPDDDADDLVDALLAAFVRLVGYATGHPVIRRLARAEPDTLVELWRTGSPSGSEMAVLLLRAVADRIDHDVPDRDLVRGCELLARLLFAEQLLAETATVFDARDQDTVRAVLPAVLFPTPSTRGMT